MATQDVSAQDGAQPEENRPPEQAQGADAEASAKRGWWEVPREATTASPAAVQHLGDLLGMADEDAGRRVQRATDVARGVVQDARAESAAILDHARATADRILAAAQAQSRQELAEARHEADAVLRRATDELRAVLAAAGRGEPAVGQPRRDPLREQRLAKLVLENAELARKLRRVNDELVEYLQGEPASPTPQHEPEPVQEPVRGPVQEQVREQAIERPASRPADVERLIDTTALDVRYVGVVADEAQARVTPSLDLFQDAELGGPTGRKARKQAKQAARVAARQAQADPRDEQQPARPAARRRGGWGRLMYRARWSVLIVTLVAAIGAGIWGPAVVSTLSSGGFDVPGSESALVADRIAATVGRQGTDVVALYTSTKYTVDSPEFQKAVQAVYDKIPAEGVESKTSYWSTNKLPVFASQDRRSTWIGLRLTGNESQRQDRFVALKKDLAIDPAVATTQLGGVSAIDVQISDQVSKDLTKAETISAPVLGFLLVLVFASFVAAGLPLMVGGLTVILSFVILRALTYVTDISVFAVNIVTVLGLGLSIDYALLIVSRFREEQRAGYDTREALARTMTTAGRSVAISATIVATSMCGLLFFPMVFLRSMAYGGVAAVAIAAIASLTFLPALIGVLGPKVNALRIPIEKLRPGRRRDDEDWLVDNGFADPSRASRRRRARGGSWERLARSVMRRPVVYTLLVSAFLLTLAYPVLHVKFGGIDARQLPVGAESRVVNDRLATDFAGIQLNPIDVLVEGGGQGAATTVSQQIAKLADVKSVRVGAAKGSDTLLAVDYNGEAVDPAARGIVEKIRALTPPSGSSVIVGGYSAQQVDLRANVASGLWKMAALTFGVTFLLLFWAFGSVVLPIKAIFMNILAVSASLGVVVLVFQEGYLSNLLHFSSTGVVELTQPILVLAILFGVSTDYEVFLLSRIREQWDATLDNTGSVATGVQRTAPLITSAALLILVVIAAFSTSQIVFIKLIGVGMFVAILIDSTIIRALLVPATMRLLGHWNWWAPGPLLRFWERHRPASEELDDEPGTAHGAAEPEPVGAR